MPAQYSTSFFDNVETQNMPSAKPLEQPWKSFHEPNPDLAKSGTLKVETADTDETGGYLGRSTQTGSLGGH